MGGSFQDGAYPGSNLLAGDIGQTSSGTSYTIGTGLTNTAGTLTADLSTGKAGGQSAVGGTAASEDLTLSSTAHATKGKVRFGAGASYYDEANQKLFLRSTAGAASPGIIEASDSQGTCRITVGNDSTTRGPTLETVGLDITDVRWKVGSGVGRVIRLEARGGASNLLATPEWHIGGTDLDNPPIVIADTVVGIGAGTVDTNLIVGTATNNAATRLAVKASKTIASAAAAAWDGLLFDASTATLTGATNVTGSFAAVRIKAPTISAASALFLTGDTGSLVIDGAPSGAGAGPATVNNPYSLLVRAGNSKLAGNLTLGDGSTGGTLTINGFGDNANVNGYKFMTFSTQNAAGAGWDFKPNSGTAAFSCGFNASSQVSIAFFGSSRAAKATVSGSKGANAALASLMSALSAYGLVTDSTT
jgi:hypothetical protein